MMDKKIKFADLFAGCGGLSFGFQNHPSFQHLLASDIWAQAKTTYEKNFDESKYVLADLGKEEDLETVITHIGSKLDLLIGGPPCKGFSTLNNSKTPSSCNTLVDQYLIVVERTKPNVFLIENVRGFRSKKHPSGSTYSDHVKRRITCLKPKYNSIDFLLNASDYGLAQNRIRYFVLATKRSYDPKGVILKKIRLDIMNRISSSKPVLWDVIGDLPRVGVRQGSDMMVLDDGSIIYNHKSMKHSKKLEKRLSYVPKGGGLMDVPFRLLTNHLKKVVKGEYGSGGFAKNIYGRMDWDKPSGTIVAGMDKITVGRFVHPDENRLLSPRECARIQSFPDNFVFSGGMVSQYYQIGNAVPPKISELFSEILADTLTLKKGNHKGKYAWS